MNGIRNETYIVRSGDTLWKIASLFQVGVTELINANPQIPNPDLIYVGQKINIPSISNYQTMEQEIIRLVNEERSRRGLSSLREDWEISRVARMKAQDMIDNNYFSHTSPIYGSPFKMLSDFGIRFLEAAENIASGQQTAQQVMSSWMNSSGHRANILNANFNIIGVGVARKGMNGPYYFVQIFTRS
jgi:uncharacterized YkwD family protein/spore coat assembly protein SafA